MVLLAGHLLLVMQLLNECTNAVAERASLSHVARAMLQTCMQQPLMDIHDEILLSSGRENPVKLDSLVLKPSVGFFCTALWRVTIPCGACKTGSLMPKSVQGRLACAAEYSCT